MIPHDNRPGLATFHAWARMIDATAERRNVPAWRVLALKFAAWSRFCGSFDATRERGAMLLSVYGVL